MLHWYLTLIKDLFSIKQDWKQDSIKKLVVKSLNMVQSKKINLDEKLIHKLKNQFESLMFVMATDDDVDFVTSNLKKLKELELNENK